MRFDIFKHLKSFGGVITKHSPVILSTMGASGVVATSYLAVKATPKVVRKIDKFRHEVAKLENASRKDDSQIAVEDVDVSIFDYVKLSWREYLPAVAVGTLSIVAIFGAHRINIKRSAAILSAYTMTDRLYSQYREKVEEELGETKHNKILDKIAKDDVEKDPPPSTLILSSNTDEILVKDSLSGRYFRSTMEKVREAQNDINESIFQVNDASLNELYDLFGLEPIQLGEHLGWNTDNPLRLYFSSTLTGEGIPCAVIMYQTPPSNEYNRNTY